jgi:phage baseplate assembly protein W
MEDRIPVGIVMPYRRGDSGFFKQTYSDMERAINNLKMLLMTAKGERPMMPTYGSDLREIIFENNTEGLADDLLEDAVKSATETWMPEVHINSVITERDLRNQPESVVLKIKFFIANIPDSDQELTISI